MQEINSIIKKSLSILPTNILDVSFLGGMTNKNYLAKVIINNEPDEIVVRIPGAMTQCLISRKNEAVNSSITSQYKFNVDTYFFDDKSGIKITKFLKDSKTLDHTTIRDNDNLIKVSKRLKELHSSNIKFNNEFNVFREYDEYLKLLKNKEIFFNFYEFMPKILSFFDKIRKYFEINIPNLSPCHNDLVPENILFKEQFYFIDWEYSGMNDLYFDLAAFLLESGIDEEQQKLFLHNYFEKEDISFEENIIKLYQFSQDVLWTLWTFIKQENNEIFEGYAEKRIKSAVKTMHELEKIGFLNNVS